MPRDSSLSGLPPLDAEATTPLVGGRGPDLQWALNAFVTWSNSTTMRTMLMDASGFPLAGDLAAFLVVNQLVYRGTARPSDLADAVQVSKSNVTRIVRRLEAADLVVRGPDPHDDRAVVVALTHKGRDAGRRIIDVGGKLFAGLLDEWSPEELLFLERLVVKLARGLDRATEHSIEAATGIQWPTKPDPVLP